MNKYVSIGLGLMLALTSLATAPEAQAAAQRTSLTEYALPPGAEAPFGLCQADDGAIWVGASDVLARIDSRGRTREVQVPTADAYVGWLTCRPDGSVWFAERDANRIGRIDPRGRIREFVLPTPDSVPQAIVFDHWGRLWYTASGAGRIGRIDPDGTAVDYPVPTANAGPLGLALGSDGALWFTERSAEQIGRFDPLNETFREYPLPAGANPQRIVAGHDGALWFSELAAAKVGRISTAGQLTEYPVPSGPVGIVADRDGLWYAAYTAGRIGHLGYDGVPIAEYQVPTPDSHPIQITRAYGRNAGVWVSEQAADQVARLEQRSPR